MDDAFVARVDHELAGLDRILNSNCDESTMQVTAGLLPRFWFVVRQFRLGIAVTVAMFLFLWML